MTEELNETQKSALGRLDDIRKNALGKELSLNGDIKVPESNEPLASEEEILNQKAVPLNEEVPLSEAYNGLIRELKPLPDGNYTIDSNGGLKPAPVSTLKDYEYKSPSVGVREVDINIRNRSNAINGKYDEDDIIDEISEHIRKTYAQHYVNKRGEQTVDSAIADGDLMPWARTNVKKYISRYGKKEGFNREDLLKAVHNLIFMIVADDLMRQEQDETGK